MRYLTKVSPAASLCSSHSKGKNVGFRAKIRGGIEISDLDNINDFPFFITIIRQFVKLGSIRLLDCNLYVLLYSVVAFTLCMVLEAGLYSKYHFLLLFPIQVSSNYHIYP